MTEGMGTGQEIKRLQTMLEAARLLNSTLELRELTTIILEVVRSEISVERVSVFVVDRERKKLHALVSQGIEDDVISLPIGVGIAGTVAVTGEILDTPDAYADERFDRSFDARFGYYTNDLFTLPVYNRNGEIVGVLQLLNRSKPITDADREFLLGISVYIGLALENAWLHSQVVSGRSIEKHVIESPASLLGNQRPSDADVNMRLDIESPLVFAEAFLELTRDYTHLSAEVQNRLQDLTETMKTTMASAQRLQKLVHGNKREAVPVQLDAILREISASRVDVWERQNIRTKLILESVPAVLVETCEIPLVLSYLLRSAENAVLHGKSERDICIRLWAVDQHVHLSVQAGAMDVMSILQASAMPADSAALTLAQKIVEGHNGRLLYQRERGGTTFVIELPALAKPGQKREEIDA